MITNIVYENDLVRNVELSSLRNINSEQTDKNSTLWDINFSRQGIISLYEYEFEV